MFPDESVAVSSRPVRDGLTKRDIALVLVIATAGLLLRLCTISSQSFWVDEYFPTYSLHMPSLSAYLRYISFIAPDNVPLYLVVNYAWGKLVGADSLVLVRCLSVLLGTACIPLLYAITRAQYGRMAAAIAASCLALSPFHIDIAMGTRPNVLTEFLALVSVASFIAILQRDTRKAWTVNVITNGLLIWTHVLNLLVIAIEGLFILFLFRQRPKRAIAWAGVLMLTACSAYLWVASVKSTIPNEQDDFYMQLPPLRSLLSDLLADDAVMTTDPFSFQGETWRFFPDSLQRVIVNAHPQIDSGMMLFFGACLAGLAWRAFRQFRAGWTERPARVEIAHAASSALLLAIAVLPVLMLVVLAFIYRPAILPRYTSYSSFAFYAAAGATISSLPLKSQRGTAFAALLALYVYQLSVALPAATRTNWLGTGRLIQSELSPDDLILVKGTYLAWETFHFNWKPGKTLMLPAYTLEAISAKSARFLEENARPAPGNRRKVWAIVEPFTYTFPPLSAFETSLTQRGLRFTRTDFKGMNGLYVYRIEQQDTPAPSQPPEPIPANVDFKAILNDLGYAENDTSARDALRLMIDAQFPRTPFYYTILALQCLNEDCLAMGKAAAQRALALDPNYPFAHEIYAAILGASGDAPGALSAYEKAVSVDRSGFLREYAALFDAWYRQQDPKAAAEECRRLDRMGYYMPFAFRVQAGTAERPSYLTMCGAGIH